MTAEVSVVIPVWDEYAGDQLLGAVRSVQAQDRQAELVVVDNASQIAIPDIDGARVLRLSARVSTGAARNAALPHLETNYVVFLDADDVLLPGALSTLVESMQGRRGTVACVLSIVDAVTGQRFRTPRHFAGHLARVRPMFQLANAVWSLLPTQGCTIMRVDDVRACGGYGDRVYGEDWVLAVSLTLRGPVRFLSSAGLRYHRRGDSPGSRALSTELLLDNARSVRERIRTDPASPRWLLALMPLIAVMQTIAARIAHPAYRSLRRLRWPWRS
jgi:glycosyltransferase involved in cell wall biosynthesis